MKSARASIVAASLLLVLLPSSMLLVAYGYERSLVSRYQSRLQELEETLSKTPEAEIARRAAQEKVQVYALDGQGRVVADSKTGELALGYSALGGVIEELLERAHASDPPPPFTELERAFPPISTWDEVQQALRGESAFGVHSAPGGQVVLFSFAAPTPDGGARVVVRGSHRGVRRLLELRPELAKLAIYQLGFALLIALVLGRWLIRPLERLADNAARYPQAAIADPELLVRPDEIGELSRALDHLARSLAEKQRTTAELAADLTHELKNPLATIAAAADLLSSSAEPSEAKRAMIQSHILEAVERLRATVDELLSLARLEAALPREPRTRVNYRELLESVLAEYRRDPRYAHVRLELHVDPLVDEVELNRPAWERALRNLLDNAVIQPSAEPVITVRVGRQAQELVTSVRDRGPGISEGNRDKILRRFFTARPEGAPLGTGLGLSIVQAVAEAHRGRLTFDSTPGQGAEFRLHLPATPLPHGVLTRSSAAPQ